LAVAAPLYASLQPILTKLNYRSADEADQPAGPGRAFTTNMRIVILDAAAPGVAKICALASEATKVVVVTAGAGEAQRSLARSGAHAVIARAQLDIDLPEWIENFAALDSAAIATVLIVDDDSLVAERYGEQLKFAGFGVLFAGDATELIRTLQDSRFDLILMDIHLSDMSGFDMTRMIRQSRSHIATPIVFMSGEADPAAHFQAIRDGGDDFLPKGVAGETFVEYIRHRVQRARTLRSLIDRDGLTGLLNHVRFRERLGLEFERSRRRGSPLSVVMFDIDHFKRVNDLQGHQAGDMVIATLSRMLSAWLRRTDVVARYGGEEFVALLLDTDAEAAAKVADAFRRHVRDYTFHTASDSFLITLSGGVAGSASARDAFELIAAADAALYEAKRGGRNQIRLETRAQTGKALGRIFAPKTLHAADRP
jgi:diguanylate cyclase (GGDEF)-like protein